MEIELNPLRVKVVHAGDEVLKGASKAVDAPDGNEIDLAFGCYSQHLVYSGTLVASFGS